MINVPSKRDLIIDFKFTDLIPPDTMAYEYFRIDWEFIKAGFETTIYVENAEVDWSSKEILETL